MRTVDEVDEFVALAEAKYIDSCSICNGTGIGCDCQKKFKFRVEKFLSCIPKDFLFIDENNVKKNKGIFNKIVKKYVSRLNLAFKNGYGVLFTGDNGVGKTYFMSYILGKAIESGRTAYYITSLQLEHYVKIGFGDNVIRERLDWMLESDFLAIDEFGKEKRTKERTFMDQQIERILKQRYDNSMPFLLSTNLSHESLIKMYGSTIGSMINGKLKIVQMAPGDFRLKTAKSMNEKMDY